jgi:hypothetical protein
LFHGVLIDITVRFKKFFCKWSSLKNYPRRTDFWAGFGAHPNFFDRSMLSSIVSRTDSVFMGFRIVYRKKSAAFT